jgi:hypothetical protein
MLSVFGKLGNEHLDLPNLKYCEAEKPFSPRTFFEQQFFVSLHSNHAAMTRLVLEIQYQPDLDLLIPLLRRLQIRFSKVEAPATKASELAEAIRIVSMGCDMSSFGDALQYQIETRSDRALPFRNE